ncbi:hypothetical protein LCGC14_1559360 [marine sediment metagenome]|uniref:Uncharacterized protein n=1 Tax=marine sediment metagenome TaxID=412755 RepID=A0A0F9IN06_9ZZZZ
MHWAWALSAATLAVGLEVLYKRGWSWPEYWWLFIPVAIIINFSVYKLVTTGPTLLLAIVAFSLSTLLLRVLASQFLLGEALAKGNLVAVVALVTAAVVGRIWR